jgi:choline dehydrogenase-like flavoprotein
MYSGEYSGAHPFWHDTFANLGISMNRSHFSGSNIGAWTSLTAVHPSTGHRAYSANSYYLPVSSRPNLEVLTDAVVREVILERQNDSWSATGVRFEYKDIQHIVNVKCEVIVSCGAVQSPQILEMSGIGDPDILKNAGVTVKVPNSNVGENLQDHMSRFPTAF